MFKNKQNKNEKGQGLVEYALILVLVAIVVIVAATALGPQISSVFERTNNALSGAGGAPNFSELCAVYGSGTTLYYHQMEDGTWSVGSFKIPNDTAAYDCP